MPRSVTFVHAADLHLGASFSGLRSVSTPLANQLVDAVAQAYRRIIDLCLSERVDFLVLAGDSFNEDTVPYRVQHVFFEGLQRLNEARIPVYLSMGNHDPLASWGNRLELLPDNVSVFRADRPSYFIYTRDGRPLACLAGRSYEHSSEPDSLLGGLSRPEVELQVGQTPFVVGVLHTGLGDPAYAPCSRDDLRATGLDYWALGHIHASMVDEDVPLVMPGSPQGLDINENAVHGCYLVTLEDGRPARMRFCKTESIAWEHPVLDITGIDAPEELIERMVDTGRDLLARREAPVCARFELTGRSRLFERLSGEDEGFVDDLCSWVGERFSSSDLWLRVYDIDSTVQPPLDYQALADGGLFPSVLIEQSNEMHADSSELTALLSARFGKLGLSKFFSDVDVSEAVSAARDECLDRLMRSDRR